jgi:hypothetical protein
MTSTAMGSMPGITEQFAINFSRMVVALWFLYAGYLLFKRANRALVHHRTKRALRAVRRGMPYLAAQS